MKDQVTRTRFLYRITQFFVRELCWLLFGLKVEGKANVPKSGAFILACNHQSWFDPPIVGCACPREICFAAKKELFEIPIIGRLIRYLNAIPVKRSGFDRAALESLGESLENGFGIIIFPEGTRAREGKFLPPKAGVGMIAIKHDVQIVPVHISGTAQIGRQLLMRKVKVRLGSKFSLAEAGLGEATGKEGYRAVASEVMRRIAKTGGVEAPD